MRTTLQIDDQLYREVKEAAAETGRTLTAVVEDALRLALSVRKRTIESKPFKLPVLDLGKTLPGVDLDNSAALLDLMEADDDSV
ncbi:MAG: ribbon-helix-helix protein, CopG family [Pirellulales bacterium]